MNQTTEKYSVDFSKWIEYLDLDRIVMMPHQGRELLAATISWTEKRDGSNISAWLKPWDGKKRDYDVINDARNYEGQNFEVMVSSRNMQHGVNFLTRFKETGQYEKVVELLKENPTFVVFGEYMQVGKSMARAEVINKKPDYIVFDIYDKAFAPDGGRFLGYNAMYQQCHHFDLQAVKLLAITRHTSVNFSAEAPKEVIERITNNVYAYLTQSMGEVQAVPQELVTDTPLFAIRDAMLRWSREAKREGVVGKAFNGLEPMYFKEKVDMPSHVPTLVDGGQTLRLPPLPDSEIFGAIGKAKSEMEVNGLDFLNKKVAMPIIVNYVGQEAKKHKMRGPSNLFIYYQKFLEIEAQ